MHKKIIDIIMSINAHLQQSSPLIDLHYEVMDVIPHSNQNCSCFEINLMQQLNITRHNKKRYLSKGSLAYPALMTR